MNLRENVTVKSSCHAKSKGNISLLHNQADTGFCLCRAEYTLCRPVMQILSLTYVIRDTLSNMVSCFLMSRQQAHMTTSNSQFSHIYIG